MTYTAIDFETAHANYPCEIGLTRVEDGIIIESKSWLIKPACFPYMNPWNERVHGISAAKVANAATFEELWGELKTWIDDRMSRKTWKQLSSHSLGVVCDYHQIKFNHHRAGDDAHACALIALKAFETVNATSVEDGLSKLGVGLKRL